MIDSSVERRLAAILLADIVGYSRLMGLNEEGTLGALKSCRGDVIDPRITEHGGRIVKTTGDGVLAEFPSVLQAVRSAIEIQRDLSSRNRDVPLDKRLLYRIGINLGDIIFDGGDIFGDGVNVAARLEGLAEPGGIAVSGAVYDQVRNKLDVIFEHLGPQLIKNIAEPVIVYRVAGEPIVNDDVPTAVADAPRSTSRPIVIGAALLAVVAIVGAGLLFSVLRPSSNDDVAASVAGMAHPLPEKPSLVVLPFDNLSGDSNQAQLGDGLAENLISSLSKSSKIFVIARNSAFTYKGRPITTKKVAEELGVRFVLTGGIQRSGDKVRITVQLVDAVSGHPVWSEKFDRTIAEIFALQDEITLNVVAALQVELTEGEMSRVRRRGTENLEAWLLVNQSIELFQHFTKEDNARAREFAEKAVALDPNYPDAYVRLARAHITDYQAGWVRNRAASFKRSVELAGQALKLDESYPDTYNLLGAIYLFVRRHDEALTFAAKAVELSPNFAIAKASLGMVQTYAGLPKQAILTLKDAMRLSPYYPDWFLKELGRAYFQTGQFDEAVSSLELRHRRSTTDADSQILLAAAYAAAGKGEQARATLATFIEKRPYYTGRHYSDGEFYRDPEHLNRVLTALRKAGLPD